jgi:uncharacterized protein YdcH (DUF465 family)
VNVEPHDLHHDFPNYREQIERFKATDVNFASLCEEYDRIDREVCRIEEHDIPIADSVFEDMKKLRLRMKDEVYKMLCEWKSD